MRKKTKELEDAEEIKSEDLKTILKEKPSEKKVEKEDDYFFPHKRVTVRAGSLEDARAKLKKQNK